MGGPDIVSVLGERPGETRESTMLNLIRDAIDVMSDGVGYMKTIAAKVSTPEKTVKGKKP